MTDIDHPERGVSHWVDLHGHDSPKTARLIVQDSNDDELVQYVMLALIRYGEKDTIEVVETIHDELGDG
ncbi:hypothetical protein [Natrinema salinisoli]|uniref:hypothetical protein n=1 Tax=Natrinema salinisoli TaxID=2878535 RepID=UPI001CEFD4CF|nr:hypothetical protein [Natrinema salinisoli]